MAIISPESIPIFPSAQSSAGSVTEHANRLKLSSGKSEDCDLWGATAVSLQNLQTQLDSLVGVLRDTSLLGDPLQITDPSGRVIVSIGHTIGADNANYSGIWANSAWFGGDDPSTANIAIVGDSVTLSNVAITDTIVSGGTTRKVQLDVWNGLIVEAYGASSNAISEIQSEEWSITSLTSAGALKPDGPAITVTPGAIACKLTGVAAFSGSEPLILRNYTGTTRYGPIISAKQSRGTPSTMLPTVISDTLGGLVMYGSDGSEEANYSAGVRAVASETHTVAAHGSSILLEATALGTTAPSVAAAIGPGSAVTIPGILYVTGKVQAGPSASGSPIMVSNNDSAIPALGVLNIGTGFGISDYSLGGSFLKALMTGDRVIFSGLPTSAGGLVSGQVWQNGTVLNIVP